MKTPSFDAKGFIARYRGSIRKYAAKEVVYQQGDPAVSIYFIESGRVRLSIVSEQGREAILGILKAGDFFGESCLLAQPLRISTATALTDCSIAVLNKTSVVKALDDDLPFSAQIVSHLLHQNKRLREHLIDHLFNSSEKRLARVLLLLANYGKEARHDAIIPKTDQETLAKMVGTTRARINHFMNKFRRLGFIEYGRDIVVHSSLLNVVLYDQPVGTTGPPADDDEI
jgi:CRP-like cAMP-binding protein